MKTQLADRQLEGSYWQIWRKDKNGDWKILHDEFSIDNWTIDKIANSFQ